MKYGWDSFFEKHLSETFIPGRIFIEHRKYYKLYSEYGELKALKTGRVFYNIHEKHVPVVGDWCEVKLTDKQVCIIRKILPRKTKFSRKKAGTVTEEQILASNIDIVFIVSSLNEDLNIRRLERYIAIARDNKIKPVIILNKSDLVVDYNSVLSDIQNHFPFVELHVISAIQKKCVDKLSKHFEGNNTIAVVGSSGVGKSTLINILLGKNKLKTRETRRSGGKGTHTTTTRELLVLPSGGLIIDTPGLREIQLWETYNGISELFEDIEKFAANCKFNDCKHETEPGCAVIDAVKNGILSIKRLQSYKKLLNESENIKNKIIIKRSLKEKQRKEINTLGNDEEE